MSRVIYLLTPICATVLIWTQINTAQFLDYDENWGQLLGVILLSLFVTIIISTLSVTNKKLLRANKLGVILFLTANNPVTIIFVIYNYAMIFGTELKV